MNTTVFQKYAPTIFAALVVLIPAADVLAKNPSPIAILQFVALIVTTVTTFALVAPWKQIVEWAGVVVAAVLPLAISGELTWANWALVAVAVVKALAVHLGVTIRKDDTIDARDTPADQVPVITAVSDITDDGELHAIEPAGDDVGVLESAQPAGLDDDEPKHLATS